MRRPRRRKRKDKHFNWFVPIFINTLRVKLKTGNDVTNSATYDGGRLRGLDERQRAVVSFFGDVDKAILELVLLEDAVELVEEAHPLVPLLVAVGQDQDGGLVAAGGGELGRRHLRGGECLRFGDFDCV